MMQISFPRADIPETLQSLRSEVRKFLEVERESGTFVPRCSGWMVFDAEFSSRCAAQGYIGMTWPRRYGGQERNALERYAVIEELLAAGAPVGAHWIADRQSGPQILAHGSEALKRRVLPAVTRGEIFFCIGMSETEAGSDLSAIRSRASKVAGGWQLNGSKIWSTNAHRAHYMIGLFRTAPVDPASRHSGMTQFVIDLSSPGVSRRPIRDIVGEADFNEVRFDDVFVPDEQVLGAPGEGWDLVIRELAHERSGPERFLSVFPLIVDAVSEVQGRAQATEHRVLGRLVAHLSVLREMSMSIAGRLAQGESPNIEPALVKDLGNAIEQEIPEALRTFQGLQPYRGGSNYQHHLADAILAAPSFGFRGGTREILRGVIARALGLR